MDGQNHEKLVLARRFLEKNIHDFPCRKCQTTARFLNLAFGLEEIAGHYVDTRTGRKGPHTWNLSFDGYEYVDLSLDQFNSVHTTYAPVSHLPLNTATLIRVDEFTENQRKILTPQLNPDFRYLVEEFRGVVDRNFDVA